MDLGGEPHNSPNDQDHDPENGEADTRVLIHAAECRPADGGRRLTRANPPGAPPERAPGASLGSGYTRLMQRDPPVLDGLVCQTWPSGSAGGLLGGRHAGRGGLGGMGCDRPSRRAARP
jgi:hypothetical protein